MRVFGVVEFVPYEEYYGKYGHEHNIESHPVLAYTNDSNIFFFKDDDTYKVLYEYMTKEIHEINVGKEKFPELFL
ncbi:MAG: hypothetical protein J7L15_00025 [Clostridiales bacterium]|nr:hypothetical protein [Clostridiales bacterium]